MIPTDIKNDIHVRCYKIQPTKPLSKYHFVEVWERKPTDRDIQSENGQLGGYKRGTYYGEWEDVTPLYKALHEKAMLEQELNNITNKIKEQQEPENTRGTLDNPIGSSIRYTAKGVE